MIRAMIVDDEFFAREELEALLLETGKFEILEKSVNAIEALKAIATKKPDVVFLDIQMPMITGLEMLSMIDREQMPHIVFVTAYDQYALKAIEEKAFDYLLKPIDESRLEKCISELEKTLNSRKDPVYPTPQIERVPCTSGNKVKLINPQDIEFISSDLSGVKVIMPEAEYYTGITLKVLENKTELRRCHKQYLININRIDEIQLLENGLAEIKTYSGNKIPVSRKYLKTLRDLIGF